MDVEVQVSFEDEIYAKLRDSEDGVRESDIERPEGMSDRDYGLALHGAIDRLLFEGVTIARKRGRIYRTNGAQTIGRVRSFARTFNKKGDRIVKMALNAAEQAADPLDKERLEALALRRQNAILTRKQEIYSAIKPRPKGV